MYDDIDAATRSLREQYAFPFQPPTETPPRPAVHVTDVLQLAAVACALGATGCGGPLSAAEADLVAAALDCEPPDAPAVEALDAAIRAGNDPLGELLYRLRPAADRRLVGAFYTPPAIVEAMLDWALSRDVCRVVDPGCGSGRFVAAVVRRHPVTPVLAIDADPLATVLTRATLAVLGARDARVLHRDYLTLTLPPVSGRTAFVGNPPYVRHHTLSPEVKAWAQRAGRQLGLAVSGLTGLHGLFFLATALHARSGDAGCFVTSAEWLDTGYGAALRELLTSRLGLQGLTLIDPRTTPFDGAMTTALITRFVDRRPTCAVALQRQESAERIHLGQDCSTAPLEEMAAARRWGPYLRAKHQPLPGAADRPTATLSRYARVHRGIATGANDYFVLSRTRAADLGILQWCRPVIARAEEIINAAGVIRDSPDRLVLLVAPRDLDRAAHPALDAYLRDGEHAWRDGKPVAARYLPSHRTPWWYLGPAVAPAIVVSYMARQAPAFAANPDGLLLLNIAHGIWPHAALSAEQIERFAAHLNGIRASLRGQGRTYQGGLEKFEPRELEAVAVGTPTWQG